MGESFMDSLNSENSGSSFSNPSVPPDIRNWFSSYKYESFVLDTCELGGIVSEEMESNRDDLAIGSVNREKLENFNVSGEIRKANEHGNLNSNEDSLHSSSILSDPPDLRNWFSSYTYESPLLDTNDGLKSCVFRESECEKDEPVIREKIKFTDEVANSGQFQETNSGKQDAFEKTCLKKWVKCSGSSIDRKNESHSSHSLFSEPPDIGNWFPDYEYESPVLDTSDELKDTLTKDRESNGDRFVVEETKREEQENFSTRKTSRRYEGVAGKKMCSNEFCKCTSSLRKDEQENRPISKDLHCAGEQENIIWQGGLCFEKILDKSLAVKQMQGSSIGSKEGVENSVLSGGDFLSKLENVFSSKVDSQLPGISRSPGKNARKSSKKFIDKRGSIERSSETKVQTEKDDIASHAQKEYDQVSGPSLRQSNHGSNNKENEGKDNAENGYITTRKNKFTRTNDENSPIGRREILLQCSTNKGGEKDGVVKRKVLAETTNVQPCEAIETTGKWRCPQKSKPHRGPPLKQLRLEQWVHRV